MFLFLMCKRDLFEDAARTLRFQDRKNNRIEHTILKRGWRADVVIHTVISNTRASRTRGPPLLTSSAQTLDRPDVCVCEHVDVLCAEGDGLLFICIGFGGRNRSLGIEGGHRADGKDGEGVVQGSGYSRGHPAAAVNAATLRGG